MKIRYLYLAVISVLMGCEGTRHEITEPIAVESSNALEVLNRTSVNGRFIVVLREGVAPNDVARDHSLVPTHIYKSALNGFAGSMGDAARSGMLRDSRVVRIEPDGVVTAADLQAGASWGLDRIDQRSLPLSSSYSYGNTGAGVTTYIIDTGIRYDHQEFGGRATFGFDSFGGDGSDCNGHGTHVAGTAGGAEFGVAKGVALVSVRVLDCGALGTWSGVIAGIDWIVANRLLPAVANISLTGSPNSSADEAVRRLIASGVVTTVAAGNNSTDACAVSPARVSEAITTGATDSADARAAFSNWGECIDWFSPGEGIVSAASSTSSSTEVRSGTSMAAPHSTGTAALYLQSNPSAPPGAVRDTLLGATTRGIVSAANSANNHLLFSRVDNRAPVAAFRFSCIALSCTFTDESTDADGGVQGHNWDLGDGTTSIEKNPSRTYASAGAYTVRLEVADETGAKAGTTKTISVSAPADVITLSARGYKVKGALRADLSWSGATSASVDLWRNGKKITTTPNDGLHTDIINVKGGGSFTYRVCSAGTLVCSNDATVTF